MRLTKVTVHGAIAGLVGGLVLALWFLIIDAIAGQGFRTPGFLASALLGTSSVVESGGPIALYSVFHFAAFMAAGFLVAWLMSKLGMAPNFLLGLVVGFLMFDVVFYTSVSVAGVNIVDALGWPEVFAGNLMAGVAITGTLSYLNTRVSFPVLLHGLDKHEVVQEGLMVGLIGAGVVAFWFLLHDLVEVRPFFTPGALGSAIFLGITDVSQMRIDAVTVLGYSLFHFAAFITVGIIAAVVVWQAEETPAVLLAGVILFAVFEAFFLGITALVSQAILGTHAWWTIAGGNLLAAICMGFFLYRRHPGLKEPFTMEVGEKGSGPRMEPAPAEGPPDVSPFSRGRKQEPR